MYAMSPAEYGAGVRWGHFAYGVIAVGSLGFVHFYFGTGKGWLLGAALGCRLLAVVVNFSTGLNLHIGDIQSLPSVNFLGEPVSMLGEWTANPWVRLGQLAALAQVVYVVDASVRLWRAGARESRRRAVLVGGTLAFFILFASAQAGLVAAGVLRMPIIVSFPFLAVLLAMSYELSRDVLRAAQLGRELRESEARMTLASEAAGFGVWMWSVARNQIWASERWLSLFGFAPDATITFENVIQRVHPDDREMVESAVRHAMENQADYRGEYRVLLPDRTQRWVSARGRVFPDGDGKAARMLGAAVDITDRKQSEQEIAQQRNQLTHLSRVNMLGELAGSLAHELNQPLTAVLSNAQAAQRFLAHDPVDLNEVREILADIVAEDKRAGEVIRRLRLLLKTGEVQNQPLNVNEIVQEVLKLVRSDLVNQNFTSQTELAPYLPVIRGDRVQLQQVLLNLVMNGCDAMAGAARNNRQLTISTELSGDDSVHVSVADRGGGIDPEKLELVFEPFFTTKPHGLGLGLAVCRTIITAHGGKLWATNNPERGATFHFSLPVTKQEQA
jgi:PAS domain S-box-containing protein